MTFSCNPKFTSRISFNSMSFTLSAIFLLLINFSVFADDADLIDSICFSDIRAESINNIQKKVGPAGTKSIIARSCYGKVPNFKKTVMAHATETGCYFPINTFNQLFRNQTFPRCGVCAEIVGPSLKKAICTLVGATYLNFTNVQEQIAFGRTLFLEDSLFKTIAGYDDGTPGVPVPIVFHVVHCPFKLAPAAVITTVTPNDDGTKNAHLTLFNTNLIVTKVEFKDKFYLLNSTTCQYVIPSVTEGETGLLKLYNYLGQSVSLMFTLELNKIQPALTSFGKTLKSTNCYLRPPEGIAGNYTAVDPFYTWVLRRHNPLDFNDFQVVKGVNPSIEFDGELLLSASYPYPIKLSHHYSYLHSQYLVNNTFLGFPEVKTYAFVASLTKRVETQCKHDFLQEIEKTEESGWTHYDAKSSIKTAKCVSQTNMFTLHFKTNGPTQMFIYDLSFAPLTEVNFTKCPIGSFVCAPEDECDPTASTIDSEDGIVKNYTVGCKPYCGKCLTGFVCNKAARCVKEVSYNLRSNSYPTIILSLILFLVLIL